MNTFLIYTLISSTCIGISFLFYRLFLKNNTHFRTVRIFLLSSIIISLLLPLNNFQLDLNLGKHTDQIIQTEGIENPVSSIPHYQDNYPNTIESSSVPSRNIQINWLNILMIIYFAGVMLLVIRLLAHLISIVVCYFLFEKEKQGYFHIVYNTKYKQPFTFFKWIFINKDSKSDKNLRNIINHEKIHARQFHSADLILIELLKALMWYNPFIWFMNKALHQVHEFLADEGVIGSGMDKLGYQTLLLNQVAEGRLIFLASGFSQSIIKKRIVMMTKSKFNQRTTLKLLAFVPVIALIFFGISCYNGEKQDSAEKTSPRITVAPTKMNVFYLGVENPVMMSISGIEADELEVTIDNGKITKIDEDEYVVSPAKIGGATITISADGKVIGTKYFRVKPIYDPITRIGDATGGEISKEELLEAGGINVFIKEFDFDLSFKAVSFVLSATVPGSFTVREEISDSDRFSEQQIDLIQSLIKNQKLMVEEVVAIGPDGARRNLNSLVFTIK